MILKTTVRRNEIAKLVPMVTVHLNFAKVRAKIFLLYLSLGFWEGLRTTVHYLGIWEGLCRTVYCVGKKEALGITI